MPILSPVMVTLMQPFAPLFQAQTWVKAQHLRVGTLLAPGRCIVSTALYALGLQEERNFAVYHQVLNRARWSARAVSRVLLTLLLAHLAPSQGPLVFGIDETIERRQGSGSRLKGIYRDGVRSSRGYFVKAMGLRWVCLMWLTEIPWARRVWALPFLTVWVRQMLLCLRRWLPDRDLVVADRAYAALHLLATCQHLARPVTVITRLRLDAALYDDPPAGPTRSPPPGRRTPTCVAPAAHRPRHGLGGAACALVRRDRPVSGRRHRRGPVVPLGPAPRAPALVLLQDLHGSQAPRLCSAPTPPCRCRSCCGGFLRRWQMEVTF